MIGLAVVGVVLAMVATGLLVVVMWGPSSALLERVPVALRDDCAETKPAHSGARNGLTCRAGNGTDVTFSLFASRKAAQRAYDRVVREADPGSRPNGDCALGADAEHAFPAPAGDSRGRVVCASDRRTTRYSWVDYRARTVGRTSTDRDRAKRLGKSWSAWVGIPGFPSGDEKKLMGIFDASTCTRVRAETLEQFRGATVAVDCEPDSKAVDGATFVRFESREELTAAFRTRNKKISTKTNCFDRDEGRGGWLLHTRRVGKLACGEGRGGAFLEWTIEPLLIYGRATGKDPVDLFKWWIKDSGTPSKPIVEALRTQLEPKFPTTAEEALLKHVPPASRANCIRPTKDHIKEAASNMEVTAVVCGPTRGAEQVMYFQFPSRKAMLADFGEPYHGWPDCTKQPPGFKGEHEYERDGKVVGRLYCATMQDGSRAMQWTDERFNIEVIARYVAEPGKAIDWFHDDAGPI